MNKIFSKLLCLIFLLTSFPQAGEAAFTVNKGYNNQTTGSNPNTWGIVLNSNFSLIDSNLGGTLTLSVAGNSNVTLSSAQSSNLVYNFTGALTGNINVIFPAKGGFYYIVNKTTGNFTLTIQAGSSTAGVLVPQGQAVPVVIDNSVSPPAVDGFSGTQYVYSAVNVGGTANAVTIPNVTPANFSLNVGDILFFTPVLNNTASATIQTPDGTVAPIKKETLSGLADLQPFDLAAGLPIIAYWNGSVWVGLNIIIIATPYQKTVSTNQVLTFGDSFRSYVNTSPVSYTIPQTTGLALYWQIGVNAMGGTATIIPNTNDAINVNGLTLPVGITYSIPRGNSANITTDANGNLFVNLNGNRLNAEASIASASTTDLGTAASNIVSITGSNAITSFGSSASIGNPLYFVRFTGSLTLTNNSSSIILPGGSDITTQPGDGAIAKYEGGGGWRVMQYTHASGQPIIAVKKIVFTASGTYTPSPGLVYCNIEVWAAGGGGGGVSATSSAAGGGGGAGGYSELLVPASSVSPSIPILVGAAGAGGSAGGGTGGTGGTSAVGGIGALGGSGGVGSTSGGGTQSAGGAGGTGSGGDDMETGAYGFQSITGTTTYSGGGGNGRGGAGIGRPTGSAGAGNNAAANSASGGGGALSAGTALPGGSGGSGIVIITEYTTQ